jgi:hypothetical protein
MYSAFSDQLAESRRADLRKSADHNRLAAECRRARVRNTRSRGVLSRIFAAVRRPSAQGAPAPGGPACGT